MTNPYEIAGRLTKAHKLASTLSRAGITSAQSKQMSPGEWIEVAAHVGVKPPSDETVGLAIRQLSEFEGFISSGLMAERASGALSGNSIQSLR